MNPRTAKIASKTNKPNGFLIIPPWEAERFLMDLPITTLCGVAQGVSSFLSQYGVYRCGDMKKIPMGTLGKRFGNVGKRIWYMAQGLDPAPLQKDPIFPKSLGHGKVMPPNTRDKATILLYFNHMAEKVALRLRKNEMEASIYSISFKLIDGWVTTKSKSSQPTQDGHLIFLLAQQLIENHWSGEPMHQCQITALNPQPCNLQQDLFNVPDEKMTKLHEVMDAINQRFGQGSLANGYTMKSLQMPDVISPAWRPSGYRETIGKKKK